MRTARRDRSSPAMNLLPVLNLISLLIPLFLLSSQFVHLAVIDTTLPGPGQEDAALALVLFVTERGLAVSGADAIVYPRGGAPGPADPSAPTLPCASGYCREVSDYDWRGLTRLLSRIKDRYPQEEELVIVPDARVPYEVIIAAMDAARVDTGARGADGRPRSLFPQVVLADGAP